MSDEWRNYDTWVVIGGNTANDVFHSSKHCSNLSDPERAVDRSESFVQYHEPTPCVRCHDDIEREKPGPKYDDVPAVEDDDSERCPKCGEEGIISLTRHMRYCDAQRDVGVSADD
jgi:hypothetical protein